MVVYKQVDGEGNSSTPALEGRSPAPTCQGTFNGCPEWKQTGNLLDLVELDKLHMISFLPMGYFLSPLLSLPTQFIFPGAVVASPEWIVYNESLGCCQKQVCVCVLSISKAEFSFVFKVLVTRLLHCQRFSVLEVKLSQDRGPHLGEPGRQAALEGRDCILLLPKQSHSS